MKFIVLAVLAFAAIAASAPVEKEVKTVSESFDQQPDGPYKYEFSADNGIKRDEEASLKDVVDEENKPHTVLVVRGSYQYVDNDGKTHSVTYVADENGYSAQSDDIPVAPAARR